MRIAAFARLAKLYEARLMKLLGPVVGEMQCHHEFAGRLAEQVIDDPMFQQAAHRVARAMVLEIASRNTVSWREAVMQSGHAGKIYRALREEIQGTSIEATLAQIAMRNADLITSIPTEIARRVTRRAAEAHQAGLRPEQLAREIKRLAPDVAKSRIRLIARTEVSRAETDLTRARAEKIDANWYQWATSEDQRVRKSHRNMDKVLVAWNEAPSPERLVREKSTLGEYHAGACPNCRCAALPLISLDEVQWPCRVYTAGRITRMTRAAFSRLNTVRIAA